MSRRNQRRGAREHMKSAKTMRRGAAMLALGASAWVIGCGGSQQEFADQPPQLDAGVVDAAPPPPPPDAAPPAPQAGPCDPVQTLAMTTIFQGRAPGEAPNMQ